jgi:hypothetical protein
VQQSRVLTPSLIVSELLDGHPEAECLLFEAGHREALAAGSEAAARRSFAAQQAARLRHEQLRHRLDPRRLRPLSFGVGLGLLAAAACLLALCDDIELGRALAGALAVPAVLAATAVWLAAASFAALASRAGRNALAAVIASSAVSLILLVAALHGLSAPAGPLVSASAGILVGAFIVALAVAACVIISLLEPAPVFRARLRWQRAQASHAAAVRLWRADVEAAAVATEAWLGLVGSRAAVLSAEHGRDLVDEALALASALLPAHRPPP